MSRVTSAIIIVDWMHDDSILLTNVIRDPEQTPQYFKEYDAQTLSEASGGYKHLQFGGIFAAGFNYVSVADLTAWFQNLPWDSHDEAVLVMECEGEGMRVSHSSGGWS